MTFASAERAYLEPPEDFSCERCEDDPNMTHDDCIEDYEDRKDQADIERGEREREDRYLDGPDGSWEP